MGADAKSILKKCGEILINIKTRNKQSKIYTFNCVFCNANYDQLKKFSIHLDVHQELSEETTVINETEVKVDDLLDLQTITDSKKSSVDKELGINEDPLNMVDGCNGRDAFDMEYESDMDYEDCFNEPDEDDNDYYKEIDYPRGAQERIRRCQRQKCNVLRKKKVSKDNSDLSSDDLNGVDLNLANDHKKSKVKKNKEITKDMEVHLLKAFRKHSNLWSVYARTSDNNIIETNFEAIAQEVNEFLDTNLTWKEARKRINEMRVEYANEVEKQRKGVKYEMPWYSEHMDFLKENIDSLLRRRYDKSKYRRLIKMDETQLTILIEIYKKHEHFWNVNDIAFGFRTKRVESYNEIVEELKSKHNLDITAENLHRRINYIKRLYSKDKELQLKCDLEQREFIASSSFYQQMSFLSECEGPFKCCHCNEIIEKYENYHMHVAEHTNVMPFKCKLCDKSYKTFKELLTHTKKHVGFYKKHDCTECGKSYNSKQERDYHMTSHTGDRPFLCQICGASFRALHVYTNHIRRHEKRYRFECHICKRGFNFSCKLKDHIKSHLNIRDVFCDICGKAFTTKKNLKRHVAIHEEHKRYKCEVCGKEFAQDAGLRAHRKLHRSIRADSLRKNEQEF